jgi:hypothetical protein
MENKKEEEEIILELGQIIEFEAPENGNIHKKNFIIDYLDNNLIKLINLDDYSLLELKLNNKKIIDETIEKIIIKLPHPVEKGYAKQNGLVAPKWFSFHFDDGEGIKEVIKGQIVNNFEDRIEIRTYPKEDILYIDFGYKGIPLDLPIIQIKPYIKPKTKEEEELEKKIEEEEKFPELDNEDELIEREYDPDKLEILEEIGDAEELEKLLGESKEIEIIISTEVADEEKRYSIDLQKDDLSTSLLKNIKPEMRTRRVMKNIHTIINRFLELRQNFSKFNDNGYPSMHVYLSKTRPLKDSILNINKNLNWILPIVKSKKKIYDVEDLVTNDVQDIEPKQFNTDFGEEMNLYLNFKKNKISDEENKYKFLLRNLNQFYIPRKNIKIDDTQSILIQKEVETDIETIIDNFGGGSSSSIENNVLGTMENDIEKYLTAPTVFELYDIENKSYLGSRIKITESEIINIKGYLILPYEYRELCKKFLPNVNILKKSLLNLYPLQLTQLLKDTRINTNTNMPRGYLDHSFQFKGARKNLNEIHKYLFNNPYREGGVYNEINRLVLTQNNFFTSFLSTSDEVLDIHEEKLRFDTQIRINQGLSIQKMIDYLETYGIYHNNITNSEYYKLERWVNENIEFFTKTINAQIQDYNKYLINNPKNWGLQPFINIIKDVTPIVIKNQLHDLYDLNVEKKKFFNADYENIIKLDGGQLYMDVITLESIDLIQTIDIENKIEEALKETKELVNKPITNEDDDCKSKKLVLAKRYVDIDELKEDDDDANIYFDKKYDDTRYSIMKFFKSDKDILPAKELLNKVKLHLINNVGVSIDHADRDALSMIEGKKRIINGDYAILDIGDFNYKYYERRNDKWRLDEKLTGKTLDDITFCNIEKKCLNINKNCTSVDSGREVIKKKLLKQIVDKFEDEYEITVSDLKKNIQTRIEKNINALKRKKIFNEKNKLRYDIKKNKIAQEVKFLEIQISKHSSIRDKILSENDTILKFTYLSRFINVFCRKPIGKENEWWYYDSTTPVSIPLLPIFYEKIINIGAWGSNMEIHNSIVAEIASEFGEKSSSGDYIVCKHTGYYIKAVDLDVDEGYTKEGFKKVTRDVLTNEYTIQSNVKDEVKIKKTELAMKIQKIILALDKNLHIDSRNSYDFMIKNAEQYIIKKAKRSKKDKAEKRIGRKKRDDEIFLNTIIIYTVLSMYIIGIQTNIPNIKSHKSFPGCAESFSGFPLINGSDYSTINYIACVVLKMRGNTRDGPWSIIPKNNSKTFNKHTIDVQKVLKGMINNILTDSTIKDKIQEKNKWLSENKERIIEMDAFDNIYWEHFLPPLKKIQSKHLPNISTEFENKLIKEIQTVNDMQFEYLWNLKGKMLSFTFSIIESFQNIINQQPVVLETLNGEAFVENACCNNNMEPFYKFFSSQEKSIYRENDYVTNISNIYNYYTYITLPLMMYIPENTRLIYPVLNDDFTEKTIYLAYIKYCKFYTGDIISEDLKALCSDNRNVEINIFDSIDEKIEKMKKKNHNYTSDSLKILMNTVHKKNILNYTLTIPLKSSLQHFRELYLTDIYDENIVDLCIIDKQLYKTFGDLTDRFEVNYTDDSDILVQELTNIIDKKCFDLKEDILYFLNGKIKLNKITKFIDSYEIWNDSGINNCIIPEDEIGYNIFTFTKNIVTNILKIYPAIIINNQIEKYDVYGQGENNPTYHNVPGIESFKHRLSAPIHWRLEAGENSHSTEVEKIIRKEYTNNDFNFYDFFNNPVLDDYLNNIMERSKKLLDFVNNIPFYSRSIINGVEHKTIFDGIILRKLSKLVFLCSIALYISVFESYKLINISEELIKEKTESGLIVELEKKMINLINSIILKTSKDKELINKSANEIKRKVLTKKRLENAKFTQKFERLPEDEKDTENELKKHKLGDWAIGLSSKIFRYDAEQYNREREEREKDKLEGLKAGVNTISEDTENIAQVANDLISDYREEQIIQQRIDADVNEINYTGECEDNDEFEEDTDTYY